jgi:hypothetical protein
VSQAYWPDIFERNKIFINLKSLLLETKHIQMHMLRLNIVCYVYKVEVQYRKQTMITKQRTSGGRKAARLASDISGFPQKACPVSQ